jgi:sulfite reductase (NADPH) hemoprotein beta-component
MYRYDALDAEMLADRTAEFRIQVQRRLAWVVRTYDKGYGHFTTRTNIQLHWIKLRDAPDILKALSEVGLHAIQTSGNCIRNITADPYAGANAEEIDDPRVWGEAMRQWSTFHPEFSFLPRKFKIAVTAAAKDRSAARIYDIGLAMRRGRDGELGFEVMVGGGLGRTPYLGPTIREFLPTRHLLSYLQAILRVYNRYGRRDNIWKARIKILVASLGAEEFARQVEAEWAAMVENGEAEGINLPAAELARIREAFGAPPFRTLPAASEAFEAARAADPAFARFVRHNVLPHKVPGYAIVNVSLKVPGEVPGDCSAEQMEMMADLAERYSFDEARVHYEQNMILPHVALDDVPTIYEALKQVGLATPNINLATDIIACPGLDYCTLANARAIPIAQAIAAKFADPAVAEQVGELRIKISGCINACGHHHVGHIGILGVDKKGEEFYQLTLGGSALEDARLGEILGPALPGPRVAEAVDVLVDTYMRERQPGERFVDTYRRVGLPPFKAAVYAEAH